MGLFDDIFGGGTKTQSTSSSTAPWKPQQPYLQTGFQAAQQVASQRQDQGPYTGNFYAPTNDQQNLTALHASNYANGLGNGMVEKTAQTGSTLQNGALPFTANASRFADSGIAGPNQGAMGTLLDTATGAQPIQSGVNGSLSSALNEAAVNGANSLNTSQGTLAAVQQQALANPTQQTLANAGQYVNSPLLNAQIAAAQQTNNDTLNEATLPGLNRQATLGGNLNSSRAAMAEAMANRDTARSNANIDATMRGQAYNNALALAEQQRENGLSTAAGAAGTAGTLGGNAALSTSGQQQNQGQFATTAQLGAAGTALQNQLGFEGTDASTRLAGNQQLGSGVTQGINASQSAALQNAANEQSGLTAGAVGQQNDQGLLNNAFQQWGMQNGYDQSVLNDYMRTINGNYGSTGTASGSTSAPGNVAGGLLGLGGLLGTPGLNGAAPASGGWFGPTSLFGGIKSLFG